MVVLTLSSDQLKGIPMLLFESFKWKSGYCCCCRCLLLLLLLLYFVNAAAMLLLVLLHFLMLLSRGSLVTRSSVFLLKDRVCLNPRPPPPPNPCVHVLSIGDPRGGRVT